jgi:hypothetical protein
MASEGNSGIHSLTPELLQQITTHISNKNVAKLACATKSLSNSYTNKVHTVPDKILVLLTIINEVFKIFKNSTFQNFQLLLQPKGANDANANVNIRNFPYYFKEVSSADLKFIMNRAVGGCTVQMILPHNGTPVSSLNLVLNSNDILQFPNGSRNDMIQFFKDNHKNGITCSLWYNNIVENWKNEYTNMYQHYKGTNIDKMLQYLEDGCTYSVVHTPVGPSSGGASSYSTYNGRQYKVRIGPRGGKFILVKGVKHRLSNR